MISPMPEIIGNEGLRRSKKSYNPIELKQKYIGCIE